uniref:Uncharacterized protein n=1 Tax=Panagrolaimus sp. ES5 TaxID=591445 RepID=A0AC34G1T0_9BILA
MPVLHLGIENNTDKELCLTECWTNDSHKRHYNMSETDEDLIEAHTRRTDMFRIGNFSGFKGGASVFMGQTKLGCIEFKLEMSGKNYFDISNYNVVVDGKVYTLSERCHEPQSYTPHFYIVVEEKPVGQH